MTEFLRSIVRWHEFRPWSGGDGTEFATRCGDCGGNERDHPYPLAYVGSLAQQRQLGDELVALLDITNPPHEPTRRRVMRRLRYKIGARLLRPWLVAEMQHYNRLASTFVTIQKQHDAMSRRDAIVRFVNGAALRNPQVQRDDVGS
jgi:hypothetical protein